MTAVFAQFADELRALDPPLRGAAAATLDALATAAGGPLPQPYRLLCLHAGVESGPLQMQGLHVGHNWRVDALLTWHVRAAARRARRGEPAPALLPIGVSTGRCQDCGPACLDRAGATLRPDERGLVAPDCAADPPLIQADDSTRTTSERFWIAESLAAWAFDRCFDAFALAPMATQVSWTVPLANALGVPDLLARGVAAVGELGFTRAPGSAFRTLAHAERITDGWRSAVVRWARTTDDGPEGVAVTVAGHEPPRVQAVADRLRATIG